MKRTPPSYDPAAAYAAAGGGQSAPVDPSAGGPPSGAPDGDTDDAGGQDLTIPAAQVAQLQQLKQSGDMASLGQAIASLLP